MSITLVLIILTSIISITAFSNKKVIDDLIFYPPAISRNNQWYRVLSCALIHSGWIHLFFNMFVLYTFGQTVEDQFLQLFGTLGKPLFLLFYVLAQIISILPSYFRHKDDYHYRSLGASGAVSGIVFASIMLFPLSRLMIFPIPFPMPAYIFGVLYLAITVYMDRRGGDNLNHSAHFWGSAAGVVLLIVFCYAFSAFDPINHFVGQIQTHTGL